MSLLFGSFKINYLHIILYIHNIPHSPKLCVETPQIRLCGFRRIDLWYKGVLLKIIIG